LKAIGAKRFRISVMAVVLIFVSFGIVGLQYVAASPSSGNTPSPFSDYGVTRVSVTGNLQGTTTFEISGDGSGTFFVVRVVIILNTQADSDLVLDTIKIDGTGNIQVSGYSVSTKVAVVSAGNTRPQAPP
jgi:hypothetical protein